MSASFLRKVNAGDTASGTSTTTITVDATGFAVGTFLSVGVYYRTAAANSLTGVTDSKGNTWTVDTAASSSANGIGVASASLATALVSGDTITFTWAGNVNARVFHILSFSGVATSSWKDVAANQSSSGTTVAGPSVTTTNADDLLIGFYGTTSAQTVSSTTWTSSGTQASIAGPTNIDSVYIEETSTGTYNPSVTYGGALSNGRQITVAYKVASGGGSPPVNTVAPAVTSTSSFSSDQTLSCTTGTWTGDVSSGYAYQWKDGSGNISGATSSTYRIAHSEVGASIHCTVTATGTGGSTTQDSNTVGPIYSKSPIILIYGS